VCSQSCSIQLKKIREIEGILGLSDISQFAAPPHQESKLFDEEAVMNLSQGYSIYRAAMGNTDQINCGRVFLSEGLQKFLFPDELGIERFTRIGISAPNGSAVV
jgi:hypothetical protein